MQESTCTVNDSDFPELMSKKRIIKNIAVISVGVFFLFNAYDGPAMLQSTMNKEQGIGVISQAVIYACFCISSLLSPKYFIKRFGSKKTYVISTIFYLPYIISNFYPHWIIMVPAGILCGLAAPLLWGSLATYLNDISTMLADFIIDRKQQKVYSLFQTNHQANSLMNTKHAEILSSSNSFIEKKIEKNIESRLNKNSFIVPDHITPEKPNKKLSTDEKTSNSTLKSSPVTNKCDWSLRKNKTASITARVFGINGMAFLSCMVISNLMSFYILKSGIDDKSSFNVSSCVCGANYCNLQTKCFENNLDEVASDTRYTLTAVCTILAVISVLIVAIFLEPLESISKKDSFSFQVLAATFKLAIKTDLLLLIPSAFYLGQVQGFYSGEYTKAYVGCSLGTYQASLVSVCYGGFCALSAIGSGWMVKLFGRRLVFTYATLLSIAFNVFLIKWNPDPNQAELYYVTPALMGMYVGIVWSQLRALYGILFKSEEEAAFVVFHLWYSLGYCVSYALNNYFCTFVKIYVLLILSVVSYVGYLFVERRNSNELIKK